MGQALKTVIKVIALLVGILMLFGGGLCVVADVVMMVAAGGREFMSWLGLIAIAGSVTGIGWGLVKFGKDGKPSKLNNKTKPEKQS